MTEKRFTIKPSIILEGFVIIDNENKYTFPVLESTLNFMFCEALNEFAEENERLKQRIKELELLNDGLNYALQNIRKIDVKIDVGDFK